MAGHRADPRTSESEGIRYYQRDPSYRRGRALLCSCAQADSHPRKGTRGQGQRQGRERYHAALLAPDPTRGMRGKGSS